MTILRRLISAVPDMLALLGLLLLAYGFGQAYAPAGPIVAGLELVWLVRNGIPDKREAE